MILKMHFCWPIRFLLISLDYNKCMSSVFLLLIVNFMFIAVVNLIHILDMFKGFKSSSKFHEIYIISDIFYVLNKGTYYFLLACPKGMAFLYSVWHKINNQKGDHRFAQWSWQAQLFIVYFFTYSSSLPSSFLRFFSNFLTGYAIYISLKNHCAIVFFFSSFWKLPCPVQLAFKSVFDSF